MALGSVHENGGKMYRAIAANKRTTILLIVGYVFLVVGLGTWASLALNSPWPAIIIIGIAAAWVSVSLAKGVKLAQYLADWTPVSRADERDLYVTVENLAIRNGMPMPIVCISDEPDINAFAVGMSPKKAIVGITTGALATLDGTELEAVMSHEMSHIKNYDTRVKMVIIALIGSMSFLAMLCWAFVIAALSGEQNERRKGDDNSAALMVAVAVVAVIPAIIFSILAWVLGPLFSAAISRQREYLADATGVEMTRYPDGMISMLRKIQAQEKGIAAHGMAIGALYLHNESRGLKDLFSATHPPTQKRIDRVQELSRSI